MCPFSQHYTRTPAPRQVAGNLTVMDPKELNGMKVFISYEAILYDQNLDRTASEDDAGRVRQMSQAIDQANEIWRSWAESAPGSVISIEGSSGRVEVPADKLSELPGIKEQYEGLVDLDLGVGVGVKLSEAELALKLSLGRGGDIILWSESLQQELDEDKKKNQEDPLSQVKQNLSKAEPVGPGIEEELHGLAQKQAESERANPQPQDATGPSDSVKSQVVQILQQVKQQAPELEQIAQSAPEIYQSVMAMVQAVIAMARQLPKDTTEPNTSSLAEIDAKAQMRKSDEYQHEAPADLTETTREQHRALMSLKEEIEAMDWYQQRIDATQDPALKKVLEHNRDEEKEHAAKLVRWLSANDPRFQGVLEEEQIQKAAAVPTKHLAVAGAKTTREHLMLPVGSQKDMGPQATRDVGKVKTQGADGKVHWREVRAGMVLGPDGAARSSRNISGK